MAADVSANENIHEDDDEDHLDLQENTTKGAHL